MRQTSATRILLPALVAALLAFVCSAPLFAGNIGSTNDPRISIGGGTADATPFTGQLSFYVTDAAGTSGQFGSTGGQDCYEGTPGSGTVVPSCVFYNDTGSYITALTVTIPAGLNETFTCQTNAQAGGSPDLPFDACSVSGDTINFYTVDDAAPGQLTLADIGLYPSYTVNGTTVPGESFIISVGALTSGGPGWPLNTPMMVQTPEPATILLLLTGLIFLAMAGWSTRRRALVRAE